ncbi:MAG: AcrR family transcriptional regulator [Halioglobus sp.]|jgi:AcrR family transcriptional regulator
MLINAGALLFSERGFDAVSIRDLETAAGVKRNLLVYHFGDRESLCKACADALYLEMDIEFGKRLSIMKEISGREFLTLLIRFLVYFTAKHPKANLLLSHEGILKTWRIEYVIEQHVRSGIEAIEGVVADTLGLERDAFILWYYIMATGATSIFMFAPHCQSVFGVDPCEESMVEAHAEMVVSMLLKQAKVE